MERVQVFLENVKLGGKQTHFNMTLIPLLAPDAREPDYFTLEEALNQAFAEVTEVSQGGSVPDLKLINKSATKLLVVDGEELIGAKQNRIVNATFLIAGLTEITIPVSCVEQGRWAYRSQKFAYGEKVMPPSMRREHQKTLTMSLNRSVGYRSSQGMIWNEIAMKSQSMATPFPTMAMADLFEGQKDQLGEYLKAFRLVDCQVGAVFAINGRVVGLECFGYQQTFGKFFSKLVKSYALDALDWLDQSGKTQVSSEPVRHFMEGVRKSPGKSHPSLGLGENIRTRGGERWCKCKYVFVSLLRDFFQACISIDRGSSDPQKTSNPGAGISIFLGRHPTENFSRSHLCVLSASFPNLFSVYPFLVRYLPQ